MPRKRRKREFDSNVNLTNMIDVVFTLLIIFMITAPMLTQGVQVNLPNANAANLEIDQSVIEVSITRENEIFIDRNPVPLNRFEAEFRAVFQNRFDTPIFVSADREVPYGFFVRVISEIQNAGGVRLGFLTEPLEIE